MRPVVLGVDLGTTATKVVPAEASGAILTSVARSYHTRTSEPGEAVQDPADLVEAALDAVRVCATTCAGLGREVAGLSFSAALHSLLGLGAAGEPVTPVYLWADTRGSEAARRLRADPASAALHRATGTPVHPMSPLVKLRWLAAEERRGGVARWCAVKDHVLAAFTGRLAADRSTASASGLLDMSTRDWSPEALAAAGLTTGELPELVEPTEVLALSADAARRTGLPVGLPVVAGGGDGPLANLGVGAVTPGAAAVSLGTSGALRVATTRPAVDVDGRTFCYLLADDTWVTGGAVSNGGVVAQWAAELLGVPLQDLLDQAAGVPPASAGLLALPALLGERAPYWDPVPRGTLLGLRREHRREHLVRALLDGVCLRLAMVRDAVVHAGSPVDAVRATGGSLRSPAWTTSLAAAFGGPVQVAEAAGGSGLGAALLGWRALGAFPDLAAVAALLPAGETVVPDPDAVRRLAALRPLADRAHHAVHDIAVELAELVDQWDEEGG